MINATLLRSIFAVQDLFVRPYIFLAIKNFSAANDDTALGTAEAIRDAFFRRPSEREQLHIDAIERRRGEMESSGEMLEILDFGANAVSPDGSLVNRTLGETTLSSSKPKRWSMLLFYLIQRLNPDRCLEFGTCVGISTLYQAASLTLNNNGSIVTMEGSPVLAGVARKTFDDIGYTNIHSVVGKFDDVLQTVINEHQPFDLVFVDGHHEGSATVRYFEQILPSVSRNAVIIFDDIHWSRGMKKAWRTIIQHRRVKYSADLYQLGIVIVS
jgi:predicted O-methyltransferase YrrM